MNNDNFLIESSDLNDVKELCGCIQDDNKRSQAVANMLAAEISKKYFQEIELDSVTTLHEIPAVLEDINIADIYIKNNYIDVRIYFENDLPCIPKSQFESNILPLAYMFIKVNDDLSSATVTGFAITSSINIENEQDGYILLNEEELVSYYDLENNLAYNDETDIDDTFELNVFNYLDDKLEDKSAFFNTLIASPEARTLLKNAAKAKQILSSISFNEIETNQNDLEDIIYEHENNESDTLDNEIEEEQSLIFEEENDSLNITVDSDELIEVVSDENSFLIGEEDDFSLEEKDSDFLQITDTNEALSTSIENDNLLEIEQEPVLDTFEQSEDLIQKEDIDNSFNEILEDSTEAQDIIEEDSSLVEEQIIETEILGENSTVDIEQPIDLNKTSYDTNEFSTSTTPSLTTIEEKINDEEGLLEEFAAEEEVSINKNDLIDEHGAEDKSEITTDKNTEIQNENATEIDTLFNEDISDSESEQQTDYVSNNSKSTGSPIKFIGILAILIALGYFGYTKFFGYNETKSYQNNTNVIDTNVTSNNTDSKPAEKQIAMPNETVENKKNIQQTNEAINETIAVIENNLDTSILVSNLSVNWEVPAGYISSNTAKRYFTKIGKIIQLNLKTELLLLSRQPITNKISIELEYNKSNKRFETKGVLVSSGEKDIDDVILSTINKTLDIKLNMNMSVFENIVGNPVLVIRL